MPLKNGLPIVSPGANWSATAPTQLTELITTFQLEEKDFLASPPLPELAWADVGTITSVGIGIVKWPHVMPNTLDFSDFKLGGNRVYNSFDAAVAKATVAPGDLSFAIPMVFNDIGNGWQLMSRNGDGALIEFLGISGMGTHYAYAGKARKTQFLASLFYNSLYVNGLSTNPTQFTYPQGASTTGIALFTDGSGADGTTGAQHYANPTVIGSARFKNVFTAYGPFLDNYGRSLVEMTTVPHPTLSNKYSGARVTDTFGPSWMRDKFWRMMVQTLTLETRSNGTNLAGAATTSPYADAVARGMSEDNFIGASFGPRRFWILSELDNHPYPVSAPGGNTKPDFWINVSAAPKRATWGKLACNNKDFVPTFRFYGPGDPRAMSERLMRFEGDLDAGATPGAPGEIQMFFGA